MQLYPYVRLRMLIFFTKLGSLWHNVIFTICSFSLYLYTYIIISKTVHVHTSVGAWLYTGHPFMWVCFRTHEFCLSLWERVPVAVSINIFTKCSFIMNSSYKVIDGWKWTERKKTTGANDFAILFLIRYFLWPTSTIIYSSCQYTSASRIFAKIS